MFPGHDWSKCMSIMKPLSLSRDIVLKLRLVFMTGTKHDPALYMRSNMSLLLLTDLLVFLQVNGNFAATPFYLNNGTVQVYESGFSVIVSTVFGLEVSYDTNHYVRISVPHTYQNATCGLCGNFNGIRQDDFRTRQGEVVSSDVDFANSWQATGNNDTVCEAKCGGLACAACTDDQTALYSNTDHCGILQNSSGPFASCHQQLSPKPFVESCVFDLCVGEGYQPILCQALNVYASQCQQNGVQLPSWRRQGFCEIPCLANSHFEPQGTGCPATCVNPNSTQNCPLPAQESCICNAGYTLSAGVCVPHSECGCSFEGRYYRSGETVILDEDCGRRCSCSHGSMTCHSHERSCRPSSYASCWIRGPGSYHTFDGLTYQYPGACRITIVNVTGMSRHPHFDVTIEKIPRGQQGFTRVLKFKAEGTHVSIEIGNSSNVQIMWPYSVHVTAPGIYNGSLGGLCGNNNGHPNDDFRTPNGTLVMSSQLFGDSWRSGSLSAQCVENGNDNTTVKDTREYYVCTCKVGLWFTDKKKKRRWRRKLQFAIHVLQGLSSLLGVVIVLVVLLVFCYANPCPPNSHYESCGTACPPTCFYIPGICVAVCQTGCQCNDGFVLNGNQCVPQSACGCSYQGRYLQSDEQFWDGEECHSLCSCNGSTGAVHCIPHFCGPQESCRVVNGELGCHPKPHGMCSASGDPHYTTFDGKAYDFQGTCRYVLAKLCSTTDGLHQFSVEDEYNPEKHLIDIKQIQNYDYPSNVVFPMLKVNGITKHLPIHLNGSHVYIHNRGYQTTVVADFGLEVKYDGWRATISVPSSYRYLGKTCGLCGNFNGNQNDDFQTPSGMAVSTPDEFGTSWKVAGNYTCSDGCGSSCPQCTNELPARAQCEVIQAADGPFSFCHEQVDPAPYFNDCVFDVCVSENRGKDLLCRDIQAYVSACQSANVQIYPWRQNTTCSKPTTQCVVYLSCKQPKNLTNKCFEIKFSIKTTSSIICLLSY
uniref:VWFD domain-containing protein n=1 Tax=Sparus aurata TaxID=8175 RepID=A0A671TTV8_SPAAU